MKKSACLKEIQNRMPEDLIIEDETPFEFTDDEYVSLLSWIKYFNQHYKVHGKSERPNVVFPIISKRLRLDFGLYCTPCELQSNNGKHVIYISPNGRLLDGSIKKNLTVKYLVDSWRL